MALLYFACFPNLDGLVGDAGRGNEDSASPIARTDGDKPDSPTPSRDGGTDAAAPFCATRADAAFCVDFGDPTSLGTTYWTSNAATERPEAGTISIVADDAAASSPVVQMDLQNTVDGGCDYFQLIRRFDAPSRSVDVSFRVLTDDPAYFFNLDMKDGCSLIVSLDNPTDVVVRVQGNALDSMFLPLDLPALGTWHDVRTLVEFPTPGSPGTLTLTWDQKAKSMTLPSGCYGKGTPRIEFGPFCMGKPLRQRFDNILVYLSP